MLIGAIKDACDTFVADHKQKLKNRQDAYLAKHGRFWQGALTPATPPDDGAVGTPDLTLKVPGFRSSWGHVLKGANAWPAEWPFSARCDTYDGPAGKGWTLTVSVTKNAKTHTRVRDFGPLAQDIGWFQVTDPIAVAPPVEDDDLP